jgi:hypothetical protein
MIMDRELECVMTDHDEKEAAFEWITPADAADLRHLSVDGNYVGSIAGGTGNPSAPLQWRWLVTIPDSVDRKTPLTGQATDEQTAKKAAEEAFTCAKRESV